MSLIPPLVSHTASLQPRDPTALVSAAVQRAAPAVSATLTQTAVQQAKAGNRAEFLTARDLVPVTDKRDRLVGPPPTFDVNVLQHMRETRNDPPDLAKMPRHTETPPRREIEGYKDVARIETQKDQPPALDTHA